MRSAARPLAAGGRTRKMDVSILLKRSRDGVTTRVRSENCAFNLKQFALCASSCTNGKKSFFQAAQCGGSVNCKHRLLARRSSLCDSCLWGPTCPAADPAPASEPQRQRPLITLVLRGLTRSIPSHCSIQCNHTHLLMRGRKGQPGEDGGKETG